MFINIISSQKVKQQFSTWGSELWAGSFCSCLWWHKRSCKMRWCTHCLLQVGDEHPDDQGVDVNVVHSAVHGLRGRGPYGLVDGLFAGAVWGAVVWVVRKALGHLILTRGGTPGHSQQSGLVQLRGTENSRRVTLMVTNGLGQTLLYCCCEILPVLSLFLFLYIFSFQFLIFLGEIWRQMCRL